MGRVLSALTAGADGLGHESNEQRIEDVGSDEGQDEGRNHESVGGGWHNGISKAVWLCG